MDQAPDAELDATVSPEGAPEPPTYLRESRAMFVLVLAVGIVGAILAATGAVNLHRTMVSYQWGVLCFFVALDLFTSIIAATGVLNRAAIVLAEISRGRPLRLMLLFGTLLFLVSALMNNLTAVLVILPITFVLLRALKLGRHYVVGFFSLLLAISNLAGASTPIGDFPALIIMKSGLISFPVYLARAFPLCLVTAAVVILGHLLAARFFRGAGLAEEARQCAVALQQLRDKYAGVNVDRGAVARIAAVFALMFAAWAVIPADLVPPELVAVFGLGIAVLAGPNAGSSRIYRRFDLKPVFTIGVFLFVAALVQDSGVLVTLAHHLREHVESPLMLFCAVMALTAACSGLFSAGPAAAATMPLIVELARGPLAGCEDWLAVGFAVAICAGSSLFVWSATAGLPLAHKVADAELRDAAGERAPWGVKEYLPYGLAHFAVQLAVGMAWVIAGISSRLAALG